MCVEKREKSGVGVAFGIHTAAAAAICLCPPPQRRPHFEKSEKLFKIFTNVNSVLRLFFHGISSVAFFDFFPQQLLNDFLPWERQDGSKILLCQLLTEFQRQKGSFSQRQEAILRSITVSQAKILEFKLHRRKFKQGGATVSEVLFFPAENE